MDFYYLFREIVIESDDETLYQSKRASQIKRDQHLSLPDLIETLANSNNTYHNSPNSNDIPPSSSSTSSVSTNVVITPSSSSQVDLKTKSIYE